MTSTPPAAPSQPSKSINPGDIIKIAAENPQLIQMLVGLIGSLLGGLFNRKPKPPTPMVPVDKPTPREDSDDDFPDDIIPTPKVGAKVSTVVLKLARAQYQKDRFPEMYTEENPQGLYSNKEKAAIEAGHTALNWGSKFWLDLTAFDEKGQEFTRDRVLAEGLSFKTEHHVGDAFIKGHGAAPDGQPKAGYETNFTEEVGGGDAAWRSSLGFLMQFKSHVDADGKAFRCIGSVNGVTSNEFVIRID